MRLRAPAAAWVMIAGACTGTIGESLAPAPSGGDAPAPGPRNPAAPPAGADALAVPTSPAAPPARGTAEFSCDGAPALAPPPRRLWRLTPSQYANTVAAAVRGRRGPARPAVAPLEGLAPPLDSMAETYRFSSYAGTHGVTDSELRRLMGAAEDVARRIVEALRAAGCVASGGLSPCAEAAVAERGALLFGRPLAAEDLGRYVGIARSQAGALGGEAALALAFQAMLISPRFLFHAELGAPVPGAPGTTRLDPYEVATALGHALLDGPADQELWDAAGSGALATREGVAAQVARLMRAPDATSARAFVVEYFELPRVLEVAKAKDGGCGTYSRDKLLAEARLLVDDVLRTNGRAGFLEVLLTTSAAYSGCENHRIYGLTASPGNAVTRSMLPASQRAGLLTHPAFLAGFSAFDESLPVARGKFVNESLLCRPVPNIPIGVIPQLPPRTAQTTMRDRLAAHGKDPSCAACHAMLDPVGLAFERYDHYGQFRATEAGRSIDASGRLSGTDVDGPFADAVELSRKLAGSRQVARCFIRHGFRFFLGRDEDAFDACTLAAAERALEGGDLVALVTALFTSPSFLTRSQ
jgi:hypothetical protein